MGEWNIQLDSPGAWMQTLRLRNRIRAQLAR
jgi:hypothetical protein